MTLIELLKQLHSESDRTAQAVFVAKKSGMFPESQDLTEAEILEDLKQSQIKLTDGARFILQDWFFIGSTASLQTAMQESRIEDIDAEFAGFCKYLGW